MMGNAGTVGGDFQTALQTESFEVAMSVAGSLPQVSLSDALALTILAAKKAPDRFAPMARRFLVRFIAEAEPTLEQVKKVADALNSLALTGDLPALREGAERALEDLRRQLRNRL